MFKGNILLVIDSMGIGGAEKVTLTLAQGFINKGYRVDVVICDNIIGFDIPKHINLHILDFKKSFMDYTRYSRKLHKMIDKIKIKNKRDFDLILVHLQKATRLMRDYSHNSIYHIVHSTFSQSAFKNKKGLKLYFRRKKLQKIYNNLKLITVSKGIEDDLLSIIKIKPSSIKTIYNPIDIETIKELSLKDNPINETNYIVHIGRLSKVKRHDILLNAFFKANIDTKLVIVGDGEEKNNILQLIKKFSLEDKVILTGFLNNPYPIIKNAKLLVLSSEYEGLPTVLIEALALHVPVCSTNCKSGPSEILINELEQFLVETNNIDDLSKKLKYLFMMDINIDKNYYKEFLLENVIKQYLELI